MVEHLRRLVTTPWPWVIAGAVWGVLLTLGGMWLHFQPPLSPIQVTGHRAFWTEAGTWRVETTAKITSACPITVSRTFTGEVGQREPAQWYRSPARIGDLPYRLDVRPGSATIWYEYAIKPGQFGEYQILVEAWGCDNGFRGEAHRALVPVGTP